MSHFTDRLLFFRKNAGTFAGGHGVVTTEDRAWEEGYRTRWQHDKIVRSTHGVNCTGSCSWKVYVKGGIVTWETQQTDYPRTRPDMPNHEPRGCARGASYSWYLYSGNRLKYPLVRGRLLRMYREARASRSPVDAWASLVEDPEKRRAYTSVRGLGGFVRAGWDEAAEMVAAANVYTIRKYGPDRICGFSPIPAMSMVSHASGSRYLQLIGGVSLSFYDWYCDLPPSSPQTWGEQTDVPESADWYNAMFLMLWGSNVPQTRTPDAHFFTEARYKGLQSVVVCPDYSEASKFADLWLHPRSGTDSAVAMAMGHVILTEFHVQRRSEYFSDYCRKFTDFPFLVRLVPQGGRLVPERFLRASDFADSLGQKNNPEWKPCAFDETSGRVVVPRGSIGFRWGEDGAWNLEERDGTTGNATRLKLSLLDAAPGAPAAESVEVGFPYFGTSRHASVGGSNHPEVLVRRVPAVRVAARDGETLVTTVYDLILANYGVDRGLGGQNVASSFDDDVPYTPAWQETITGVKQDLVVAAARQFAQTAEKTHGKSMVILGAGINHWYNMDMTYRGIINMLVFCGCVGQSGGGWAHYVGQEKVRPQVGWATIAFATDWCRPPRHMNGTSFFYAHTDQWRYERVGVRELLSPTAPPGDWDGSLIDFNVRSARMGWLPTAPHLDRNPIQITRDAAAAGEEPIPFVTRRLKTREIRFADEDPDNPVNFPRNMFVWRSNIVGSSGKGHEYFLRHFLGSQNGVLGQDLGETDGPKPREVTWRDPAPDGKLDLLVTLDFRMSTTCLYSDVVLPTATWYEKNDINTSDMHTFIHPFVSAVDPGWESRPDWDIFRTIALKFSEAAKGVLGKEKDLVMTALLHDSPAELGQAVDVKDWKRGDCEILPGKTTQAMTVVERDYPNVGAMYTSLGPLVSTAGAGGKGIAWSAADEVGHLARLNGTTPGTGPAHARPRLWTDIEAAEAIMTLAPETNGAVAVKAWNALAKRTGRAHGHLAASREGEKLRFRDIAAQPRRTITSPIWSGLDDEEISYNANWINVHELIPWRTLTGRQELYQDHLWMRAFGEALCVYKPPVDLKTVSDVEKRFDDGRPYFVANFLTPHQKWGIHSTYSDNLIMLTLSRGGPIVWMSEIDAKKAGLEDNDWIEVFNVNGSLVARAVVSQRIREGTVLMYHAQEKLVSIPGSELTGNRGGIHNSVTRIVVKPTHMIGGYAQISYGLNYYGTVGANRDEFVIVRKLEKVDWLEGARDPTKPLDTPARLAGREGAEP
ncbi:MAG TPA: nitrate reductase subunit alpha [Spirochaetia bacterium]|nr:nitrate reductase subunit alpha [Spirochaetia bacterium]